MMNDGKQRTPEVFGTAELTTTTEASARHPVITQASSLASIETYVVPTSVLDVTRIHLSRLGSEYNEGALCWAGALVNPTVALITTALVFGSRGRWGVQITTSQAGLLYEHCYTRGLTLLAQVHSHPQRAFHSSQDEKLPHSAEVGFLSIVVPNYGHCSYSDFSTWAVFQQVSYEKWRQWGNEENGRRLRPLDTIVRIP